MATSAAVTAAGWRRWSLETGVPIGFEKHKVPSSLAWCPNGTQPVARVKVKRGHRGKSVRATGGGLFGLGKRA